MIYQEMNNQRAKLTGKNTWQISQMGKFFEEGWRREKR
jgi:hypothetical protein